MIPLHYCLICVQPLFLTTRNRPDFKGAQLLREKQTLSTQIASTVVEQVNREDSEWGLLVLPDSPQLVDAADSIMDAKLVELTKDDEVRHN